MYKGVVTNQMFATVRLCGQDFTVKSNKVKVRIYRGDDCRCLCCELRRIFCCFISACK